MTDFERAKEKFLDHCITHIDLKKAPTPGIIQSLKS
jgi:hypothetical protein